MTGRYRVFNSMGDIRQFGDMVVGGYQQVDAGMLPEPLHSDLMRLTNTLAEGMSEQYRVLKNAEEGPVTDAEKEMFADMHTRYCEKVPGYLEEAEKFKINVRDDAFAGFF